MIKTNKLTLFATLFMALLFASCNERYEEPETDTQKRNNAFIERVEKSTEFTKLLFLNESTPIYYKVLKEHEASNDGRKPFQNSKVSVIYKGMLPKINNMEPEEIKNISDLMKVVENGEVFDSTSGKETSLTIFDLVNGTPQSVVKGMRIALQSMTVGDRWLIIIPWNLGYGRYNQSVIPGYSTLIFDLELTNILTPANRTMVEEQ